jgi:hypothetical protein
MGRRFIPFLLTACFCLWLMPATAFAQGTTSRVTGTVTDTSGAAVPGATVTLTNEGTNVSFTTETSDSGVYTFDLVLPGSYTVAVEKQGFKKLVSTKNVVLINQPTTVNVALEVGGVTEIVTVESAAEQVQTSTSGNVGSTIEQRTLESLPIVGTRGRNPLDLLNYQPGVVSGANTGGGVHVHGSRDRAFNFTLDGIDINESSAGGSNFTPLRTNPDSIQEFQVVTSNFTAELGRSSGAQVTFITRSGTNRFTGNVFEYYQTPDFNANEYENNLNGAPKRQFVQHIFGGSVGGPIIKDRFFFFTNLQMLRAYETRFVTRTVYTQQARQGLFRYVYGGRNFPAGSSVPSVDASGNPTFPICNGNPPTNTPCIATYNIFANDPRGLGLDPTVASQFQLMPLPNNFSAGDGLNTAGFNFAPAQREKQYDFVMRFDYKFNEKNLLYVRWAQGEQNTIGDVGNGGLQAFPETPRLVDTFRDPKNLAINYRWSPTANISNEFIFGINRFAFSFNNPDPNFESNPPFTFNLVTTPLNNSATINNLRRLETYQFVDNLTYLRGSHTFKGGINFRYGKHIDDRTSVAGVLTTLSANFSSTVNTIPAAFNLPTVGINNTATTGDLTRLRNTINDLLARLGTISRAFVASPDGSKYEPAGSRFNFVAKYPEYDFYIQDTWKARPNLTFDLGLRYELKPSPSSGSLPILRPEQPVRLGESPSNTLRWTEGKLFDDDRNNFSPSVGFAWDPFKDGKTSVRANYRLAYDRMNTFVLSSSIYQSAPGLTFAAIDTTYGPNTDRRLRDGLPLATLAPPTGVTPQTLRQPAAFGTGSITVVDPDLQFPEIHQWFVGIQREIMFDTVFEANYIGNRGVHLFGGYDANQVDITNNGFLNVFNQVRNNPTQVNPFLEAFLNGDSRRATADTSFTAMFRRIYSSELNSGSVAAVAASLAQRLQGGRPIFVANGYSPFFFQRYPQFNGAVNVLDSSDLSRYNALELILKRRIKNGIGFQVGYTLAKSKDTRSFDPAFTVVGRGAVQSASSTPFDINNRRLNYAWSDFDRRHALQATYVVELPFGRGKSFATDIPKPLDWIIGGWQLAGTLNLSSGRPFTVYSGINTVSNVVSSTANCTGCTRNMGSVIQDLGTNYFFTLEQRNMFGSPVAGEQGNTGRNFFIGPKFFQMDMSLSKKFRFSERYSFDIRVDARNVTNTPSFAAPNANLASSVAPFGRIRDSVVSGSRKIQISGKFNF